MKRFFLAFLIVISGFTTATQTNCDDNEPYTTLRTIEAVSFLSGLGIYAMSLITQAGLQCALGKPITQPTIVRYLRNGGNFAIQMGLRALWIEAATHVLSGD